MEVTIADEWIIGFILWLVGITGGVVLSTARAEWWMRRHDEDHNASLERLWGEFDSLHPRRANPGHRVGINHHHEREE